MVLDLFKYNSIHITYLNTFKFRPVLYWISDLSTADSHVPGALPHRFRFLRSFRPLRKGNLWGTLPGNSGKVLLRGNCIRLQRVASSLQPQQKVNELERKSRKVKLLQIRELILSNRAWKTPRKPLTKKYFNASSLNYSCG